MQIQPRLSPLAARAALAAAVTPLEHASQSCLSNKPNMQPTFRASISPPKICENGSRKHGKSTRVSARRNHGSVTSGQTFATSVEQASFLLMDQHDHEVHLIIDIPIEMDINTASLVVDFPVG
ncbi:hypothetical protein KP509_35G065700 [Ceratopteris richardii]|uniref:Uncharacterized protein n=1 Tax=Ceratopteris richardii TaxID=49495 RepID=A0A8T2QI34_CERRI|nr:hypothetical protein KP509_35G065700 [Ceratopteris richardii]